MGRLPDLYVDGRKILSRMPFNMSAVIDLASNQTGVQFPGASFLHDADRPFEVHRMIPRVFGVFGPTTATPGDFIGTQGDAFISVGIFDASRNQTLTRASTPVPSLVKSEEEHTWEWTEPYYLEKGGNLLTSLDSSVFDDTELNWRVKVTYQGYLVTLAPLLPRPAIAGGH